MAKKSWFNIVKRFFISDTESKQKNKEKRRRRIFGRFKVKRLPSLTAPSPQSPLKERTQNEAEEEQSKHALTVAIASTAAAEAAVAAAHAAAEIVWLTGTPQSSHQCWEERKLSPTIKARNEAIELAHQCERKIQESAAVKIQTAFRGYLARKALQALKGIVKLQAIIRGQAVRRQAMTTLKCLQSIINIQSHVCARRFRTIEDTYHCDEHNQFQNLRDKIIRMDSNSQKRWDDSFVSKKEAEALFLSKKEAMMKRERIKEYSYSHRKSAESERNKVDGRWRYWLDQWIDTQLSKSKELEDLDTVLPSNVRRKEEFGGTQLRLRNIQRQNNQGMDSPVFVPRRSSLLHHRKQCSLGDENSFTSSPVVPTYMAATKSAKAKARSLSSPKLRPGSLETCSDTYSPCKKNISLVSSFTSEVPSTRLVGKYGSFQQRSPGMKGLPSPIKSRQTAKDLSFDSECSMSYWDRQRAFR